MDDVSGAGEDLDRISALPDELLHVILSFVGDAQEVTRTAVLSRRWRRMWVHASTLKFSDHRLKNWTMDPGHFASFVDWVLAHRGETAMDSLTIWMTQKSRAASPARLEISARSACWRTERSQGLRCFAA
ncbi:hypothetical protein PR202_gb02438 [Eleusine coracana subsp. coracana]|uniref:F-box domain-containing protein n=1 Tax=Eleusine coracana subsp. coracana TaxID=191504 RepID=A0AAV5DYH7_ELECO|nr:hypothetical protein PR202_gb02438 [Eleusine coracana subsp. coracana]